MKSIDIFIMSDGKKITIDWLSVKSIMRVPKKYWPEIQKKIQDAIDFVNSDQYKINFFKSMVW